MHVANNQDKFSYFVSFECLKILNLSYNWNKFKKTKPKNIFSGHFTVKSDIIHASFAHLKTAFNRKKSNFNKSNSAICAERNFREPQLLCIIFLRIYKMLLCRFLFPSFLTDRFLPCFFHCCGFAKGLQN